MDDEGLSDTVLQKEDTIGKAAAMTLMLLCTSSALAVSGSIPASMDTGVGSDCRRNRGIEVIFRSNLKRKCKKKASKRIRMQLYLQRWVEKRDWKSH